MPLVHAGLVSKSGRGVLLAGPAGSGKSTSAITSACSGFDYLSEDLVALQSSSDEGFVGHSLYSSAFMEPDHLTRFPLFDRIAIKGKYGFEKKYLVLLSQIVSLRFAHLPHHAVVAHLPRLIFTGFKGEALLTC
jgi:hypothetical protein